jgi:3-hydroxyisobutyrate dehydrogenase-like beta-hydroxyacid dehydrogenase
MHCGDVGAGQMVKILNNMMVFMTVNALTSFISLETISIDVRRASVRFTGTPRLKGRIC